MDGNTIELEKNFAKGANSETWRLLEKENRTSDETERMIAAAFTSLYHWQNVGTTVNLQRGLWLLSHVYAEIGDADSARKYAVRCMDVTDRNPEGMEDFDIVYAHEALARASLLRGDLSAATREYELAKELGGGIRNEESRQIFNGDFQKIDWSALEK